ncbi:MAG: hypothetical protein R3F17_12145 [Planctomycetota bacterium]
MAAGTYTGLHTYWSDVDYYQITVPAGYVLTWDELAQTGDTTYDLFDGVCGTLIASDQLAGFEFLNSGGSAQTVMVKAYPPSVATTSCSTYDIAVDLSPDYCSNALDDGFEDNDSCAQAVPLAQGSHTGLFASTSDRDFYVVSLPDGMVLDVHLASYTFDVDFDVYAGGCAVAPMFEFGDFEVSNLTGAPMDVVFEAIADPTNAQACTDYALTLSTHPDPCAGVQDDGFEDNDDCASAAPIGNGTWAGLVMFDGEKDTFACCVPAGGSLDVDLFFSHATADLDVFLREASSPECGSGYNAGTSLLAYSISSDDNESMQWINTLGVDVSVVIEVDWYASGNQRCNSYDLVIAGAGVCGSAVDIFCDPADVNSSGLSAIATASGNPGVGCGVHLDVSQGPPGEFAYFLIGAAPVDPGLALPQGGHLCLDLGQPVGRFNLLGPMNSIGRFTPAGTLENLVGTSTSGFGFDVPSTIPLAGSPTIESGATWHFQLWYRDFSGAGGGANLSNGVSVTIP